MLSTLKPRADSFRRCDMVPALPIDSYFRLFRSLNGNVRAAVKYKGKQAQGMGKYYLKRVMGVAWSSLRVAPC